MPQRAPARLALAATAATAVTTAVLGGVVVAAPSSAAPPTAVITLDDDALSIGETAAVTITFDTAPVGFTLGDLSTSGGTLTGLSATAYPRVYTVVLTPTPGLTRSVNTVVLDNTGVTDGVGDAGTGTSTSANYAVDTQRPTASIMLSDTLLGIGETSAVTITFSEAVSGFTNADLAVDGGTLSAVSSGDGGITWTTTFTPTAGTTTASGVITLAAAGVSDQAGNAGTGAVSSPAYSVDNERPTVTSIVLADPFLTAGETSLVTITFSEAVTGFTNADLTVPNGTLSGVTSADGGITWTATLTPAGSTSAPTNAIALDLAGLTDASGNTGAGTVTSTTYAVATVVADTNAPTSRATGPARSTRATWTIGFTASDDSAATSVALFVRVPGAATYARVATDEAPLATGFTYTGTTDGTYAFYTVATDAAGNTEAAPAEPDVVTVLDTTAPGSRADGPALVATSTWSVSYAVTGSDVSAVALFVRAPGATDYREVARDSGTLDGTFDVTGDVDGAYAYYTIATDTDGNVQLAPAAPDAVTVVDTTAPVLRSGMGREPVGLDRRTRTTLPLRFLVDEPATATMRVVRAGAPVRTFPSTTSRAGVVQRFWAGRRDDARRLPRGLYRVVVTAVDDAGNRSTTSVRVRITR